MPQKIENPWVWLEQCKPLHPEHFPEDLRLQAVLYRTDSDLYVFRAYALSKCADYCHFDVAQVYRARRNEQGAHVTRQYLDWLEDVLHDWNRVISEMDTLSAEVSAHFDRVWSSPEGPPETWPPEGTIPLRDFQDDDSPDA